MPIPSKKDGEKSSDFMGRCMGDETMKKEYPSQDQRVAICMSKATEGLNYIEAADFANEVENYGFEEEVNEDNFYAPLDSDYVTAEEVYFEDSEIQDWDIAAEKPGLWENIRRKKEREGKRYKPARPGDPDRPTKEAWKRSQSEEGEMAKQQIEKMHMQLMQLIEKMKSMPVEFEEWTADMISKSELYVQNIYDFVMSYKPEVEDEMEDDQTEEETEASEYQGRKVKLGKPFRTPGGPKKFSVYVKNDKGNVVKVNFGDPKSDIKRDDPGRRKNFRARHNCDTPGPRHKARYWSCRQWRANSPVED